MTRTTVARYLFPILILAILVGTTFPPDVRPTLIKAFGENPLGFPVVLVVASVQLILLLPLLWVLHHLMLIAEQAIKDGASIGKFGLLAYAAGGAKHHPGLRRSRTACLFGLIYFVAICAAWIAYASWRGI